MSEWTIAAAGDHVVAVVAHPDDESFGCGSLLALAVAAGARVTVICATRGEAGDRRPDPVTDGWPLALLREAELCHAAVVLGVDDVIVCDYRDSGVSGPPPDGALVEVPLDDLARDLTQRLAALEPDVVLTLDGSDGHRDHRHLRDAVDRSAVRLGRSVRLVHSSLARSSLRAWANAMRCVDPSRAHAYLDTIGRPDEELTAVDVAAVLDTRERAIACHLSQTSPFDGLPTDLRRRMLTVDHIVESLVTPAVGPRGSGVRRC